MSELVGHLRAALAGRRPDPGARPDLFCTPFRPTEGPLSDHVIKVYRGGRDPELLELVARRHDSYVECLRRAGLCVPETRFVILNENGFLRPVVVQKAMPNDTMLPKLLANSDLGAALSALDRAATAVTELWRGVAQRPERIGLHASPRNFAIDDDGPVFLETCPPLISYTRDEMGRLMLRFTESGLMRSMGAVLPGRVRELQDNWYSAPGTLSVLIEGALKQRSKDRAAILSWAQGFSAARLTDADRAALRARIERRRPGVVELGGGLRGRLGIGRGAHPNV